MPVEELPGRVNSQNSVTCCHVLTNKIYEANQIAIRKEGGESSTWYDIRNLVPNWCAVLMC